MLRAFDVAGVPAKERTRAAFLKLSKKKVFILQKQYSIDKALPLGYYFNAAQGAGAAVSAAVSAPGCASVFKSIRYISGGIL